MKKIAPLRVVGVTLRGLFSVTVSLLMVFALLPFYGGWLKK
jgi:hypothetical protein